MARLYVNNFKTNLAQSVAPSNTTFDLVNASGLGSPSGGDFVACTIDNNAGTREIIYVTSRSSNTITCTRAQEGTTAQTWAGTETVEARLTATAMNEKLNILDAPSVYTYKFISSVTASSSASLSFTNLGNYSKVVFVFNDLSAATDDVILQMRTSSNNGSSYDSTVGNYQYNVISLVTSVTSSSSSSAGQIHLNHSPSAGNGVSNTANRLINGQLELYNPAGTSFTYCNSTIAFINSNNALSQMVGSGVRVSAADVDALQFFMSSGNIASGKIYAYGLSKT